MKSISLPVNYIEQAAGEKGLLALGLLLLIGVVLIVLVIYLNRKKKYVPWRIEASKKWLAKFRADKDKFSPSQRFGYIRKIDHFLWEEVLMSCFEERGYKILRTKMTRDGGSDGFVTIDKDYVVIQAKRYKGAISKRHVKELAVLVNTNKKYDKGLFIHTGKTTAPVKEMVKNSTNFALISGGDDLLDFLDGKPVTVFGKQLNAIQRK